MKMAESLDSVGFLSFKKLYQLRLLFRENKGFEIIGIINLCGNSIFLITRSACGQSTLLRNIFLEILSFKKLYQLRLLFRENKGFEIIGIINLCGNSIFLITRSACGQSTLLRNCFLFN